MLDTLPTSENPAIGTIRLVLSLAADTDLWLDDVWIVDSTPVECARSRETVKRSDLAGRANYGYCRSHSRFYRCLKLHLVCTPAGLPVTWTLADPKIDERQVLAALIDNDPHRAATRPSLLILADKGYIAAELDRFLAARGISLLRPTATAAPHAPEKPCSRRCGS